MYLRSLLSLDSSLIRSFDSLLLEGKCQEILANKSFYEATKVIQSSSNNETVDNVNLINKLVEERNYLRKSNSILLEKIFLYELAQPQTKESLPFTNKLFHLNYEFVKQTILRFRDENELLLAKVEQSDKAINAIKEEKSKEIHELNQKITYLEKSLNQARESLRAFLSGASINKKTQEETKTNPPSFKINYTVGSMDSETNEGISDKLSFGAEIQAEDSKNMKKNIQNKLGATPISKAGRMNHLTPKNELNANPSRFEKKEGLSKSPSTKLIPTKSKIGLEKKKSIDMTSTMKATPRSNLNKNFNSKFSDGLGDDQFTKSVILDDKKKIGGTMASRFPKPKLVKKL